MLGINLKPNQTFDLIFRLNRGHNNRSPPQIQYLVFVFGFYSHATIVSGRRHSFILNQNTQVRLWSVVTAILWTGGSRPVLALCDPWDGIGWDACCHDSTKRHKPVLPLDVTTGKGLVKNCWITLETERLTVLKMLPVEESHVPRLSSGQQWPECVDCALNTAVIDGRVRCCLPRFTSWSCLWFSIAHTSLCGRELGPTV